MISDDAKIDDMTCARKARFSPMYLPRLRELCELACHDPQWSRCHWMREAFGSHIILPMGRTRLFESMNMLLARTLNR